MPLSQSHRPCPGTDRGKRGKSCCSRLATSEAAVHPPWELPPLLRSNRATDNGPFPVCPQPPPSQRLPSPKPLFSGATAAAKSNWRAPSAAATAPGEPLSCQACSGGSSLRGKDNSRQPSGEKQMELGWGGSRTLPGSVAFVRDSRRLGSTAEPRRGAPRFPSLPAAPGAAHAADSSLLSWPLSWLC